MFASCDDYCRAASHKDKVHLIQAADDMMALEKSEFFLQN